MTRSRAGLPPRNRKERPGRAAWSPRGRATALVACPSPCPWTAKYPSVGRTVPPKRAAYKELGSLSRASAETFYAPVHMAAFVDLSTLAKYPFLRESAAFIRAEGVALEELLADEASSRSRGLGKARLLEALEKGPTEGRVAIDAAGQFAELLAYPVARILVSAVADTYLIRRYALREAIVAEARLEGESQDFIVHVANQLGLDLRREDGGFRLHFTDFLKFTNTMRETPWKLIRQPLLSGFISLPHDKAVRILRNAIQRRIEEDSRCP